MSSESDTAAQSLGHEVKLLVDMVVDRSAPWLERAQAAHSASERPCVGWCPVCIAVNSACGQGPDVTARAFEQAAQAVALLRAVLADRWHPGQGVHMPGFQPDSDSTPPAPEPAPVRPRRREGASRVQRVEVRRAERGVEHRGGPERHVQAEGPHQA